jgi:AGZA family xanthine/uracil permease-like MFS transporter
MLERLFGLAERGTNVRTEILAGFTTFLTMAYIIFVNPLILKDAGMDQSAVFVATCLAAAFGSLAMGLYANFPIALAPGMGLNAYFTYTVVLGIGYAWQVALGAVFLSGVLFLIISILPIREWIVNSIPKSLKMAISAGIGLFLGIIALENAGIVVGHPTTLVTLGDLSSGPVILALGGFVAILALDALRVPGAVILGILATAAVGMLLGHGGFDGIFAMPPDPSPVLLQLDIAGAFEAGVLAIIFVFFMIDLFDNTGSLIGVLHRAGMLDKDGKLPRVGKALVVDSAAIMAGAAFGTSTTVSYIESAAGVKAGGRTGLMAVTVGLLFLLALFLAPLATAVPAYATAPALLYVACLMIRALVELDWEDVTEYAPAVLLALAMPLTFSIADGIGIGFIVYALGKAASGRFSQLHPVAVLVAGLFVLHFAFL